MYSLCFWPFDPLNDVIISTVLVILQILAILLFRKLVYNETTICQYLASACRYKFVYQIFHYILFLKTKNN